MSGKRAASIFTAAVLLSISMALGFPIAGCNESSGDGSGGSTPTSPVLGTYAGTWTGRVCGRGLTMNIVQRGLTLSGDYSFTDPDFGEGMSGSVNSETPPAAAVLNGGDDRRFELGFDSYNSLSGGFFKGTDRVCDVTATKS